MSQRAIMPMRVVICFDDQDVKYKDLLVTHLRAGEAAALVSPWSRADVRWGERQHTEIATKLKSATVVVLFLSAQLLANEDFKRQQLAPILERCRDGTLRVIPVVVRSCDWKSVPILNQLQALPERNATLETFEREQIEPTIFALSQTIVELAKQQKQEPSAFSPRSPAAQKDHIPVSEDSPIGTEPVPAPAPARELPIRHNRRPVAMALISILCAGIAILLSTRREKESVLRSANNSRALPANPPCPYDEWKDPLSGLVFVWVCEGEFEMGTDDAIDPRESPAHKVLMSAFWIGKYEISNEQYKQKHPEHSFAEADKDLPVQSVSWDAAKAYCLGLQHDLPTEAQWEYAARGRDKRKYPWGDKKQTPLGQLAVFAPRNKPESIYSHESGKGPFGTFNQAGNVWEWVQDCFHEGSYGRQVAKAGGKPLEDPIFEPAGCENRRAARGGSFADPVNTLHSTGRSWGYPDKGSANDGFRCVRGVRRMP